MKHAQTVSDAGASTAGTTIRDCPPLESDFPARPTGWPFKDPYDYMAGKRLDDGIASHLW